MKKENWSLKKNLDNLVLVSNGDDWEALYVNGKKVFSHHKVGIDQVSLWSARLQMEIIIKHCTEKYNDIVQDIGDFPDNLNEIEIEQ